MISIIKICTDSVLGTLEKPWNYSKLALIICCIFLWEQQPCPNATETAQTEARRASGTPARDAPLRVRLGPGYC